MVEALQLCRRSIQANTLVGFMPLPCGGIDIGYVSDCRVAALLEEGVELVAG